MNNVTGRMYEKTHDQKQAESIHVAALVSVTKFDKSKMTVDVQPLSKKLQSGKYETQPPILSVPVAVTRAGGFLFRPWIKAGDIGVVLYIDHDIDSVVSGGKEAEPVTERQHSASDAVFVGGIITDTFTVKNLPDKAIALAKEDGSIYVAVTEEKIIAKNESTVIEMMKDKINMKSKVINITADDSVNVKAGVINLN